MKIKLTRDKPKCYCGIFGIFGNQNSSLHTYYGLHALQHRGQEGAGIVSAKKIDDSTKIKFNIIKGHGLVSDVFNKDNLFQKQMKGFAAIGHNRYSTTGASETNKNIQPFVVNYRLGNLAVAHNGNLTNAKDLRKKLVDEGAIFQTSSDTEVILHLIARSKINDQVLQIKDALKQLEGAYSLVILTDTKLIAARDPHGFRPLAIGKIDNNFIATSETCALDINLAEYLRDVEPGEMIVIDQNATDTGEIKSLRINEKKFLTQQCIFEFIYFARPDSKIFGSNVDKIRRKLGKILAIHHPVVDPDGEKVIVISVPDSSNTAAIGYQNQLEKMEIRSKLEIGLIRSHYIGRTFILPDQHNREFGVRIKFNTVKGVLENKTVVLIDDSIVRGTTSKQLVKLIKEAKPKSVHLRISSPPICYPCYYGMDFPSKEELIANKFNGNIELMKEYLGVDSLEYMTQDELLNSMIDHAPTDFCTACFSGKYSTAIDNNFYKEENDN